MAEDRAHDMRRVPNAAAPTVWQEGTKESVQDFYEPHRHSSVEDFDNSHRSAHAAENAAFERGEIKTANERF